MRCARRWSTRAWTSTRTRSSRCCAASRPRAARQHVARNRSRPKRFNRLSTVGEEVLARLLEQWARPRHHHPPNQGRHPNRLVERYVRAVRDFLPRGQQDDITNELSRQIQSRFEDKESGPGRPLTEDEQVAILRSLGHPMAVAARYRGDEIRAVRGQLIGPELFPTYLTVLRINLDDHPDHRRRSAPRRWLDLVGGCRRRRAVRHPVHDRDPAFHLGGPALAARTRTAGTRGPSTRWVRMSTCRPSMASRFS